MALAASRFRRNAPQKSISQAMFAERARLLKNRLEPPPTPTPRVPGPPRLVELLLEPLPGSTTPAIGVFGVVTGVKVAGGARLVLKNWPTAARLPPLALNWVRL